MTTNTTTFHSIERAKERMGCNEETAIKAISLAVSRGKRAEDFRSREKKFLENEAINNCIALAYNGFCYIVNEFSACVTMYPLPAWFGKKRHYAGKERIKNFKAYSRMHNVI